MKRILPMIGVLMMASTALAQVSLNVNWTDLSFGGGPTNEAQSVAFNRNRVIAGEVLGNASGGVDVHVKGYNANTGHMVWDDVIDAGAVRVDASGNDAFAAIGLPVQQGHPNILIRSYTQRTGDIQWSTTVRLDAPQAFKVRGNRVLLVGYNAGVGTGADAIVVVLDRATGNLLWSATLEGGAPPPFLTDVVFWDFDRTGTDLIVVGDRIGGPPIGGVRALIVRDYRVSDGHLKWETVEPNRGSPRLQGVQLANGLVYVASPNSLTGGAFLTAYGLANGVAVWEVFLPPPATIPLLTVSDTGVFLSYFNSVSLLSAVTERRDAFTGAFVWQSPIPPEPNRIPLIRGLGIVHGYLVLVGSSLPESLPLGTEQLVVRVYDEHGTLLLEDKSDQAPVALFFDQAILGNRIVGVGRLSGIPSGGAFVRMYELSTGVAP